MITTLALAYSVIAGALFTFILILNHMSGDRMGFKDIACWLVLSAAWPVLLVM